MNQKPLFLAVATLSLLVIGGVFWMMSKWQAAVNQPVVTDSVVETSVQRDQEQDFSSQHITAISGSNQVWYEIPEMGIKLLLSKEVAEELVYKYSPKKDAGIFVEVKGSESDLKKVKDVEGVSFSSKHVLEYNKTCNRTACGTDSISFSFAKVPNKYMNEELAFGMEFLKQFNDFYLITGASPQAVPFATKDEEEWFYQNVGSKMPSIPPLKEIFIELLEAK